MASGRRDYTWGFLNEATPEGRYTESFVHSFGGPIIAGGEDSLYSYTVPEGYRLAVNRIDISSTSRAVNLLVIGVDPVYVTSIWFSDNYSLIFSDQNPFYIEAGKTITVDLTNFDEVTGVFSGDIIGSLEQITV